MHVILPKLIGGKIAISALDEEMGQQLEEFVELAHEVDEKIGVACLEFAKSNASGIERLKLLYKDAQDFDEVISTKLGKLGRDKRPVRLLKWILQRWSPRSRRNPKPAA
jgi:hypothetical protein